MVGRFALLNIDSSTPLLPPILQTSEELWSLERQLKVAYMNKERAAQDRERALLRDMDKCVQMCVCMEAVPYGIEATKSTKPTITRTTQGARRDRRL